MRRRKVSQPPVKIAKKITLREFDAQNAKTRSPPRDLSIRLNFTLRTSRILVATQYNTSSLSTQTSLEVLLLYHGSTRLQTAPR